MGFGCRVAILWHFHLLLAREKRNELSTRQKAILERDKFIKLIT